MIRQTDSHSYMIGPTLLIVTLRALTRQQPRVSVQCLPASRPPSENTYIYIRPHSVHSHVPLPTFEKKKSHMERITVYCTHEGHATDTARGTEAMTRGGVWRGAHSRLAGAGNESPTMLRRKLSGCLPRHLASGVGSIHVYPLPELLLSRLRATADQVLFLFFFFLPFLFLHSPFSAQASSE